MSDYSYPLFIVVEGVDGSGKTTLCNHLRGGALSGAGNTALPDVESEKMRDPGTTVIGELIRSILVNESDNPFYRDLSPWAEALLFVAVGDQLAHEKIMPAIEAGKVVIQDRWRMSTIVYQGMLALGGGEAADQLAALCNHREMLQPDVCILLDVDPKIACERLGDGGVDRFESRGPGFIAELAQAYKTAPMRYDFPYPIEVVDASGDEIEVLRSVCELLKTSYGLPYSTSHIAHLAFPANIAKLYKANYPEIQD